MRNVIKAIRPFCFRAGYDIGKWADYLIIEVRYNTNRTRVERVKVHEDIGDAVGAPDETTRSTIVANIKHGKRYRTIRVGESGDWKKGQRVHLVNVGNDEFIRTDAKATASDHLKNLPEF